MDAQSGDHKFSIKCASLSDLVQTAHTESLSSSQSRHGCWLLLAFWTSLVIWSRAFLGSFLFDELGLLHLWCLAPARPCQVFFLSNFLLQVNMIDLCKKLHLSSKTVLFDIKLDNLFRQVVGVSSPALRSLLLYTSARISLQASGKCSILFSCEGAKSVFL